MIQLIKAYLFVGIALIPLAVLTVIVRANSIQMLLLFACWAWPLSRIWKNVTIAHKSRRFIKTRG